MIIACHTWAYDNLSLHDAVGTIARLGFRAVDIGSGPHLNLGEIAKDPEEHGLRIRKMVDDFNMDITDLYLVMTHVNSPDPNTRNMRLRMYDRMLSFAEALGTPGITISPGIVHSDGLEHSFARAIPCLQYMADLTERRGLRISFEPHLDSVAPDPESAQKMLKAVPKLRLTLDIAHWIAQGSGWREIKQMLPYAAHIQIRQAQKGKLQTPFAKGKLDIPRLIEELETLDYQGILSIEYMNAVGWHGMMPVDTAKEILCMRDAIRQARQH
ncbi:MAG: sugar phosphate isomerase/epimerase [Chloroflexi bacterium]|nr:sugar phosphate isomerase/epimerase [Chloroflexota bacterium]